MHNQDTEVPFSPVRSMHVKSLALLKRFFRHNTVKEHYDSQRCSNQHHLAEIYYDGTRDSLELAFANILLTKKRLKEYGLEAQLPFVLESLVAALEDDGLLDIAEINIEHYHSPLIKVLNRGQLADIRDDVIRFDIGDFIEFLRQESLNSKAGFFAFWHKTIFSSAAFCSDARLRYWINCSTGTLVLVGISGLLLGWKWRHGLRSMWSPVRKR